MFEEVFNPTLILIGLGIALGGWIGYIVGHENGYKAACDAHRKIAEMERAGEFERRWYTTDPLDKTK